MRSPLLTVQKRHGTARDLNYRASKFTERIMIYTVGGMAGGEVNPVSSSGSVDETKVNLAEGHEPDFIAHE